MADRQYLAAHQFFPGSEPIEIKPLGNGLINDTFLVRSTSLNFVLQRINRQVFAAPKKVMKNLQQLTSHIQQLGVTAVKLRIPKVLLTRNLQCCYEDEQGEFWRALEWIQPAESRDQLNNFREAAQVGFALGHFHRLCSTLPTELMFDTLPGFHITPHYYQIFQLQIQQSLTKEVDSLAEFCFKFIDNFHDQITLLESAKQQGKLVERIIHGDPKLNNFLFTPNSDRIISLIDLDTVKPGLVHYDIGDCLRSCCHVHQTNSFDVNICQEILTHYLHEASDFFTEADFDYLYSAILLIPFELGLRFFSDYLSGNTYFKVIDSRQNLRRAVTQFKLVENITSQKNQIEMIIKLLKFSLK